MHPESGRVSQEYIDAHGGEMDSKLLYKIFHESFVNRPGVYRMENYQRASVGERSGVNFTWYVNGEPHELTGQGNGPLSAVVHSLKNSGLMPFFKLEDFSERSLGTDADARAMAPQTVAHQAPLSMEFSRQEYWSGFPFPLQKSLLHPGIKPVPPACVSCLGRWIL